MAVKIHPIADYVVAQAEEAQTRTASGLYLTQASQEKPKTAVVVAVGKEVKEIKTGDRIVYKAYTNTDVKVDNDEYILIKEEDVLATVK